MLPLNRFLSFIKLNKLFNPTDKILLAVSGGKDSVLMTHLFNAANFTFGIAHCNFKLRGDESNDDEIFTQKLAEQFEVPYFKIDFDTKTYAEQNKISIQMAARELRYNWFEEVSTKHNYDYIALAHHQNDTIETILLNLIRGTGIAGLHGILPKRGKFIRPLLFLNKDEIDAIIIDNALNYKEDSSNKSVKYARNKLRLEVIPKLKELNPLLEETFENNSRRFKELEDFLNVQTELLRKQLFQPLPSEDIEIKLGSLKALSPQKLLLFELFKPFGFSEAVLEDLVQSWNNQPGRIFQSHTHTLLLDRKKVILSALHKPEYPETLVQRNDTQATWNTFAFNVKKLALSEINTLFNNDEVFFDETLLHFPLKLRHWNKGDYFYPFGMKGKKKLSDFFTSIKLPLTEKKRVPILENGNGDILWVAGYRTDERYKITPQTKKVIKFEKQKNNDN